MSFKRELQQIMKTNPTVVGYSATLKARLVDERAVGMVYGGSDFSSRNAVTYAHPMAAFCALSRVAGLSLPVPDTPIDLVRPGNPNRLDHRSWRR